MPFLEDLFLTHLSDPRLRLRRGLDPPRLKAADRWRVFFTVACDCGTSALLYLDVSKDRSAQEVREALPRLLGTLSAQADQFQRMPCDLHRKMRLR